jgi:hypothetical protein
MNKATLAILATLSASLALAEDFKTTRLERLTSGPAKVSKNSAKT